MKLGLKHNSKEWRLSIDSCKRRLNAVFLHNGNVIAPLLIAHSTILDENYDNTDYLLLKLKYSDYNWKICTK